TIDIDEEALAAAGLSPTDVTAALEANGISVPGGSLTTGARTLPVNVGTSLESVAELRELPIAPSANSGTTPSAGDGTAPPADENVTDDATAPSAGATPPEPVRLGEIAEVELGL